MPLDSNQTMHLSSDLPSQLTIFVNPDGSSSFYVISERELGVEERTVDLVAEYTTSDNRRYTSASSLVIDPVDPTDGRWVYRVPLQFELATDGHPPVEFDPQYPPTTIHRADGDGTLTMTGGLMRTDQLQVYLTEYGYLTLGSEPKTGLPDQFLSGSDTGFSRLVNVNGGPGSGSPTTPRHVFVYYYRRTTLGPINVVPTGARIPRPSGRVIIIPANYISTFSRPNYNNGGMSWYVTGLRLVLPQPQLSTPPTVSNPTDGTLTFQGNGVTVTTTLTFNRPID